MQHLSFFRFIVTFCAVLNSGCLEGDPTGTLSQEVVGGRAEAEYGPAGYLAFGETAETMSFICGATLIAPDVAVTAAHCVLDDGSSVVTPGTYGIGLGDVSLRRIHRARAVYAAPTYLSDYSDPGRGTHAQQDIAVLLLEAPVEGVTPAEVSAGSPGCSYRYIGHGRVTPGNDLVETGYTGERKSTGMCITAISPQTLRARGIDGGLCWGDSGGPLMVENGNSIVGLLADFDGVYDCHVGNRMIFTAVDDHQDFIDCAVARMHAGLPQWGSAFSDTACHWGESLLTALARRGAIRGFPDGTFRPAGFITRAEFAALIAAALQPPPVRASRTFSDVPANHWAARAIDVAQRGGYMSGLPDGSFRPGDRITKVEIAVALASGLRLTGAEADLDVLDDASQFPSWARRSAAGALKSGLLVAYPDVRRYEPTRQARRGEVAAMIHQALVHRGATAAIANRYVVSARR